ncbi:MAG: MBOAT family O-acyltransferase [Bacteroidota bacterium]
MLFNSLHFLIFFIIVTGIYFAMPYNKRWLWLLLSSCYFYMAFVPIYIMILAFTIVVDYGSGIYIEKATGKKRKLFLIASLIANIGILVVFKYYNFLNDSITSLFNLSGSSIHLPYLNILLPIGLSFHTFQAMSYTIEVYRGNQKAEKHFGIYALYVMFYPQLVAGPIERPQNLLHQFREKHNFDYRRVTRGLKLMAWGLFKKVVIADRLTILVDTVFNAPHDYNSISLTIAVVFFAFQIYCDFSGYSDMAIGAARVMGFELINNFDNPYLSRSLKEFWNKWHISLSNWFRDYLYIPLGGNQVPINRLCFNLLIVFIISGVWHGANWTFLVWGVLHGTYFVVSVLTTGIRRKIAGRVPLLNSPLLNTCFTFSLVCVAWIFFRANTMKSAFYIVQSIFSGIPDLYRDYKKHSAVIEYMGMSNGYLALSVCLILLLLIIDKFKSGKKISFFFERQPIYIRWSIYFILILAVLFLGVFENREFIYFQF